MGTETQEARGNTRHRETKSDMFGGLFSLNKLNHLLKTAFCIYLHCLCIILKCV